jgi:hypothetical protein
MPINACNIVEEIEGVRLKEFFKIEGAVIAMTGGNVQGDGDVIQREFPGRPFRDSMNTIRLFPAGFEGDAHSPPPSCPLAAAIMASKEG